MVYKHAFVSGTCISVHPSVTILIFCEFAKWNCIIIGICGVIFTNSCVLYGCESYQDFTGAEVASICLLRLTLIPSSLPLPLPSRFPVPSRTWCVLIIGWEVFLLCTCRSHLRNQDSSRETSSFIDRHSGKQPSCLFRPVVTFCLLSYTYRGCSA